METIEINVAFVEHDIVAERNIVAITYTAPSGLLWEQPDELQSRSYDCDETDSGVAKMLRALNHRDDVEAVELFPEQPLGGHRASWTMHIAPAANVNPDDVQRAVRVSALVKLLDFPSIDSMLEKYQLSTTVKKPEKLQSAGSEQRRARVTVFDAMAANAMDPDKCAAAAWKGA